MSQEERRLAAIMFTDIQGYSALTHKDEKLAIELLEEHRQTLRAVFARQKGRVVKTIGDGFLVEFPAATNAVISAIEVQRAIHILNMSRVDGSKIALRIGIHLGEVLDRQGDILGDGVNIAARIEPLSDVGGICITKQVFDQVHNKIREKIVRSGTLQLKNISTPVEVYKIELNWKEGESSAKEPDRRRIAVLPLVNMIADPGDQYFADGMTEELISTISKIRELTVISRTSVMKYKGAGVSMSEIGQELGVGTVLEGSVRKSGNRVRITEQLVEVRTDGHLWSQSYDRDLSDVFAIQSDIAQQVAEALKVQLLSEERRSLDKRATENVEAHTLYLKGRYYWNERTKDANEKALRYFQEATTKDPMFALAYVGMADCYNISSDYGWTPHKEALPKAKSFVLKALELDEKLAEAHATLGLALLNYDWDFAGAEREFKRAIELKPNYASAYQWYSILLAFVRRYVEAFDRLSRASELDPLSPIIGVNLGNVMFKLGQQTEAIEYHNKLVELHPKFPVTHLWLAFEYLHASKFELATDEMEKALELSPDTDEWRAILVLVYQASGRSSDAERTYEDYVSRLQQGRVSSIGLAIANFGLGNKEEGFRILEKAYSERDPGILYFSVFPWAEKLREDPRWMSIERRIGLPPSQSHQSDD